MTAKLIDGKALAQELRTELKQEVATLLKQSVIPGLAVIIVGEDPASETYVKGKMKACEAIGMYSKLIRLPVQTSEGELLTHIDELNRDPSIHGLLVQLPLPDHISEAAVIHRISPQKDVDGFHPINVGNMLIGEDSLLPCTPHGIVKLIESTGTLIEGKKAVVVGRSNIVGKPISLLLLQKNATVTICHSRTQNLEEVTRQADILVAAVGRQEMIGKEHVSPGAVVIDVGIHRTKDGKLAGDVRFEEVQENAGFITPVPGGVGPMTITMLLYNTIQAAKQSIATSST